MSENNQITQAENNSEKEVAEKSEGTLEEIDEVLDGIPEEHRNQIKKMMIESSSLSSIQMRGMITPENPIAKKITEEHITQYLNGAEKEMENSYAEKKHNKIFAFLITLLSMGFLIVIIFLLKDMPEIMEKVLYAIGGVVAGAFGGYGFGKHQKNNDD